MNFSLIGAAGYVAPRHMKAIKDTGNVLISVFDIHDSLGVLDQYFPDASCFSDFARYDAFHAPGSLEYVSICTPNHLHFSHIKWAIEKKAKVICEKPLVLNPDQINELRLLDKSGTGISTILQLRLLPSVLELKRMVDESPKKDHQVEVDYVSARGNWYFNSWKANEELSGGLVTNIGIHLFDLLLWVFGPAQDYAIVQKSERSARGILRLQKASVNWFLSIDPKNLDDRGQQSFRQMTVNGHVLRLDEGMENLHSQCYHNIFNGDGPGIEDAAPSIFLCNELRKLMH